MDLSIEKFLKETIFSFSGWRKIVGKKQLVVKDYFCFVVAAYSIADFFIAKSGGRKLKILIARDSRGTGQDLINLFCHVFDHYTSFEIDSLDVIPITETVANVNNRYDFFIYFTASHNPPEYNGLKIGNHLGEILPQQEANELIDFFYEQFKSIEYRNEKIRLFLSFFLKKNNLTISNKSLEVVRKKIIFQQNKNLKRQSQLQYKKLLNGILNGEKQGEIKNYLAIKKEVSKKKYQIICDFNGSARANSIDKIFFRDFGFDFLGCNKQLGVFAHGITPEGDNLSFLKKTITQSKKNVLFGYSVDCDGDRGNFIFSDGDKKIYQPDAQSGFALNTLAKIIYIKNYFPASFKKMAVITNDATSLKIDYICKKLKLKYFQAEVGEANILKLANLKKKQGLFIPMIGEGSNGGSIVFPQTVRDPLTSVINLLRLLFLPTLDGKEKLIDLAIRSLVEKNLHQEILQKDETPQQKLLFLHDYLQGYKSTNSFDKNSVLKVKTTEEKILKQNYEKIFIKTFKKEKKNWYQKYNFDSYVILNYEGHQTKKGVGNRKTQSGGFKILFFNSQKEKVAFFWMRSSKTEPVYRFSVDFKGSLLHYQELFRIHQSILMQADNTKQRKKV